MSLFSIDVCPKIWPIISFGKLYYMKFPIHKKKKRHSGDIYKSKESFMM